MNNTLTYKKILAISLLSISSLVQAGYKGHILGNITLSQTGKPEQSYQTGAVFDLNAGEEVCLKSGRGYITIVGGKSDITLSHKTKACQTLPEIFKSESNNTNITQLFKNTSEGSVGGMRAIYTIYKKDLSPNKEGTLQINANKWNSSHPALPITLQIISFNGNVVEQFENNIDSNSAFVIPKNLLVGKNGYTIKIQGGLGKTLLQSKLSLAQKPHSFLRR